jgi:hypothetical protein
MRQTPNRGLRSLFSLVTPARLLLWTADLAESAVCVKSTLPFLEYPIEAENAPNLLERVGLEGLWNVGLNFGTVGGSLTNFPQVGVPVRSPSGVPWITILRSSQSRVRMGFAKRTPAWFQPHRVRDGSPQKRRVTPSAKTRRWGPQLCGRKEGAARRGFYGPTEVGPCYEAQGLKPLRFSTILLARLKPCPDTKAPVSCGPGGEIEWLSHRLSFGSVAHATDAPCPQH